VMVMVGSCHRANGHDEWTVAMIMKSLAIYKV